MNTYELFIDGYKLPKPLSKKETYELLEKKSKGDDAARKKIAEHNIRLVLHQVAKRFKYVDYDKNDLVSVGIIGLMKAINAFDISKEIEFATFATRCIDNEILMFLRKIKKYQNIDSLDSVITYDKDGNDLKIVDILSDDIDIEEEYTDNETYQLVRQIVKDLPSRDREIIMKYFGFYDGKRYTQSEIARDFQLSQSYVSRLRKGILKRLSHQISEQGIIEPRKENKEGGYRMAKGLKTIYEYFSSYTKEQIDAMLLKLNEEEKELITLRYGDDLNNPQTSDKWNSETTKKFYGRLVPKMKGLLANPNGKKKPMGRKPKSQKTCTNVVEEKTLIIESKEVLPTETKEEVMCEPPKAMQTQDNLNLVNLKSDEVTREDYIKIFESLKTPVFIEMMNVYSPKVAIIVSLKMGFVDGKYFSTSAIANFLEVDPQEINDITKNTLLDYKEKVNQSIDEAIKIVTEESIDAPVNPGRAFTKKIIK